MLVLFSLTFIRLTLVKYFHCFSCYILQNMSEEQFLILREWFRFVLEQYPCLTPVLIIYLRCAPEKALEPMLARGRVDEKPVALEYLQKVHQLYEAWLNDPDAYHQSNAVPLMESPNFWSEPEVGSIYRPSPLSKM